MVVLIVDLTAMAGVSYDHRARPPARTLRFAGHLVPLALYIIRKGHYFCPYRDQRDGDTPDGAAAST